MRATWRRGFVHSCHDVLRIGQRVRARVRELAPDGTPWLDLQPFQADEIATIAEQAGPGDVVRVRVRRRSNNGFQVELLPGADAFVPLAHCPPELEAERDDVLVARIVRLDVADRRIVVSLADAPSSAEGARPLRLYAEGPVFLASDDSEAQRSASELDRSAVELTDVRERLDQALAEADAARAERDRLAEELRDERLRARALAADLRRRTEPPPTWTACCASRRWATRARSWPGWASRMPGCTAQPSARAIRCAASSSGRSSCARCASCRACRCTACSMPACTSRRGGRPRSPVSSYTRCATARGGTEQRQRADGARAWRCALQVHSPSARRLHFWRLDGDGVELDRVGIHDADI